MELIRSLSKIILLIALTACGQGTEVNNPTSPDEIQPPKKEFTAQYYSVTLEISEGWTYTEYDLFGDVSDPEAFSDPVGTSRTVAHFTKPSLGYFTIFEALFEKDQTLVDFVRERRPEGELKTFETTNEEGVPFTFIYFYQTDRGPRGGFLFDVYLSDNLEGVLWMRTELLGSSKEKNKTWKEFWHMVNTAQITNKSPI